MAGANATTECPQWYVRLCGLATGPFTTDELIQQVESRRFRADTEVYSRFERRWQPIQEIGLFAAKVAAEKPLHERIDTGPFQFRPAPKRKRISWKEKRKKVFSRAMRAPKLQIAPDGSVSVSPRLALPAEKRERQSLLGPNPDKQAPEKNAVTNEARANAATEINQEPGHLFPERPSLPSASTSLPQPPQDPAFLALLEDYHNHAPRPQAQHSAAKPASAKERAHDSSPSPATSAAAAQAARSETQVNVNPEPAQRSARKAQPGTNAAKESDVKIKLGDGPDLSLPEGVVRFTDEQEYVAAEAAAETKDRRLQILLFASFLVLGFLFAGFSIYLINARNVAAPVISAETPATPLPEAKAKPPITVKIPPAPRIEVAPPRLDAPARPQR